ncbi:hypothetical protein [Nocardiopsis sp. NPDC057823]|uniref:hypothetical protein n=1 Tax=Nocardiopsis sp. NPDC057823 TaxID=3346256 RepID=UPI00366F4B5F
MSHDTDADGDVEIPEAEPLPAIDDAERAAADTPFPATAPGEDTPPADQDEAGKGEPPPLPPILELAGSNLATVSGLAWSAVGPLGLAAVAAVGTLGAAAYMARGRSRRNAARQGGAAGVRGGRARGPLARALFGPGGQAGRAAGTRSGRGFAGAGRGRSSAAASGGLGRRGTTGGLPGARSTGMRSGAFRGRGRTGSDPAGSLPGHSGGFGAARGRSPSVGPVGAIRPGGFSQRGATSAFGGGRAGSGAGSLFRAARRARRATTAISDPALPVPSRSGRIRPLRGMVGAARRGWSHPRFKRTRVRFKRASVRTRDYMRRRAAVLRATALWQGFAAWWGRLWARVRGDDRYGPMWAWESGPAAMAVAMLGASERRSRPRRPVRGRVIGTSARTPGEITARERLAIGAGGGAASSGVLEGHVMKKPIEIVRAEAAAEEMREALAAFGSADVHMLTYMGGLDSLPAILRTVAAGLGAMATVAQDEQPIHPSVLEYLHNIGQAVQNVASVADELPGLFRAAHETEIQRLMAPRAGEHRWDAATRED